MKIIKMRLFFLIVMVLLVVNLKSQNTTDEYLYKELAKFIVRLDLLHSGVYMDLDKSIELQRYRDLPKIDNFDFYDNLLKKAPKRYEIIYNVDSITKFLDPHFFYRKNPDKLANHSSNVANFVDSDFMAHKNELVSSVNSSLSNSGQKSDSLKCMLDLVYSSTKNELYEKNKMDNALKPCILSKIFDCNSFYLVLCFLPSEDFHSIGPALSEIIFK